MKDHYHLLVYADDDGSPIQYDELDININVIDVNEAPELADITPATLVENQTDVPICSRVMD